MTHPEHTHSHRGWILPVIVAAQCACTSLWFAGNAALPQLIRAYGLPAAALGHITAAVQLGFITGTFIYALLRIADRWPTGAVFCGSAFLAAAANYGMALSGTHLTGLLACRFSTGFFLAGIYPVGMKIAADHYEQRLGKALGYLAGALVLGTSLPQLLRAIGPALPWKGILLTTSGLSVAGGLAMLAVPPGPYRTKSTGLAKAGLFSIWRQPGFRSATFGYFGHMWELYAFWAFVPVMLQTYTACHPAAAVPVAWLAFGIIGAGSLACIGSGYLSLRIGPRRTAFAALLLSGCCCLASPLAFRLPPVLFAAFLAFWGLVVIADSPMFSTLVARYAPPAQKGTALTLVTCIGFAITIGSIECINVFQHRLGGEWVYLLLAVGPVAGLAAMVGRK